MNNLKRVLALGLSGVMLSGMMMMGAGAADKKDFTDMDEVTHAEAVSIATALSIIDGNEDGSFNPSGSVTRGQMAKMITRAMYGGTDPVLGTKATPSFTDIKGRWDESYIEYCYSAGIINGRGDGTFDPEGNVTGTEAAKMLLSALGYDTDVYGFTGIDWSINTNKIANSIDAKLYDGLRGIDPSQALNRDSTAQMVYNALNAKTMEMRPTTSTAGTIEYTYYTSDTLLYAKYGAVRVEAVVTDNEFTNNATSMEGKTALAVSNGDELDNLLGAGVGRTPTMEVSTGKDEFGKAVIVYAKPSASSPKNLNKAEVICDVILDDNTVATTVKGFGTGKDITDYAKDNGLKFGGTTAYYTNYATATSSTSGEFGYEDGSSIPNYANVKGIEITIIDNDGDGLVDVVLQNLSVFGRVTKYSTKDDGSVTVKTAGFLSAVTGSGKQVNVSANALTPSNEELKNISAYEDIAVNDYVNVTKVSDTYYITKAETVNGDMDAFKSGKNVTVDGTTYDFSEAGDAYTVDGLKDMPTIGTSGVLDEEVTIYMDAFGYAVAGDTNAASDFLFVANAAWNNTTASGYSNGTMTAYVVMQDGTTASYVVDKYTTYTAGTGTEKKASDFTASDVNAIKGKVFKYSLNNSNKLTLVAANTGTAQPNMQQEIVSQGDGKYTLYTKGESTLKYGATDTAGTDATSKYITNDTVVFFVSLDSNNIDKVQVSTGKTAPSMEYTNHATNNIFVSGSPDKFYPGTIMVANADNKNNLDAVVFVNSQAASSDFVYLINYVRTSNDGAIYNAVVDGEVKEIVTNDKTIVATPNAYGYSMDGTLFDVDSNIYKMSAVGEVTLIDNKSIVVDGTTEGKLTSNTITALLDDADTETDVSVSKGDIVCLVYNEANEAEGVYIIKEYDDTKGAIVYYNADLVTNPSTNAYAVSVATYNSATGGTLNEAGKLKALFAFSGKADVKISSASISSGTAFNSIGNTLADNGAISATNTYYIAVIAESADHTATTDNYNIYAVTVNS